MSISTAWPVCREAIHAPVHARENCESSSKEFHGEFASCQKCFVGGFAMVCGCCNAECCKNCISEIQLCCGLALCVTNKSIEIENDEEMKHSEAEEGFYIGMELENDPCGWDHHSTTLECGHRGCNFYKFGCYTCNNTTSTSKRFQHCDSIDEKVVADKELLAQIMPQIQSESLRALLQQWQAHPEEKCQAHPEGKKADKMLDDHASYLKALERAVLKNT